MKPIPPFSLALAGIVLAIPLSAQSKDVEQSHENISMAGFFQPDLAQSFKPHASDCSGAGLLMDVGIGSTEDVTISLYDALPNAGGTMLASGTTTGSPGSYVDVFWTPVPVTPGNTYYLVFTSNLQTMCVAGDTRDPYPDGQVYANAGYASFPAYDYTFRTWKGAAWDLTVSGACPSIAIDVTGGTAFGQVAIVSSPGTGSFTIPSGSPCSGTTLGLSNPTLRTIQAFDGNGSMSLSVNIPAGACGTVSLQVVDLSSCTASKVVGL